MTAKTFDPNHSFFGSAAQSSVEQAASDAARVVSDAVTNVAGAVVTSVARLSSFMATSGARAGQMLLDAAATSMQQKSLAALQRIGTFVVAHIGFVGIWVSGQLRAAFGGLVAGVRMVFSPIARVMGGVWDGLKAGFSAAWGGLKTVFGGIWTGLKVALSGAWSAVTTVGSMLVTVLTPIWMALATAVGYVVGRLSAVGSWLWTRLVTALGVIWGVLSGVFSHVASAVASVLSTIVGWISSALASLRTSIISWAGTIGVAVGRLIGTVASIISSLIGAIPIAGPIIQIALAGAGLVAGVFVLSKTTTLFSSGIGLAARALGGLGSTLAGGVSSLGKTLWAGMSDAGRAVGSWFGGAASGAGKFLSGAGAGASNLFSSLSGAGGKLLAGASGGGLSFSTFITMLIKSLSGLMSTILAFGQAVITLLGLAVVTGVFSKALLEAGKAAMEFSKNAALLSAQSGLSLMGSARVLQGLKGFGIDGAPAGDAEIFRLKAGVFGLPGFDQNSFVERLAVRFQSLQSQGFGGRMMAQGMMKALGINSPEWLRTATTDPAKLRAQQSYVQGINNTLGLTPGAIKAYAEDVPLFLNRLGAVWDGVKMKLATTALPIAQSLLGNLTNWLGANAGNIGKWVERAVRFMFVQAPLMAMNAVLTILSTVQKAVNGIYQFGQILVKQLPTWLGGAVTYIAQLMRSGGALIRTGANTMASMIETGADFIAKAVSSVIVSASKGLATLGRVMADWLIGFSRSLAALQKKDNPFRSVAETLAGLYDTILNNTRSFQASMIGLMSTVPYVLGEAIKTTLGPMMLIPKVSGFINKYFNGNTPLDNYDATMAKLGGKSDLASKVGSFFDSMPQYSKAGVDAGNSMHSFWSKFEQNAETNASKIAGKVVTPLDWMAKTARGGGNWLGGLFEKGANVLDPSRGTAPNVGHMIGGSLSAMAQPLVEGIGNVIKPGIDSISDFARSYKASLGTESERNSRLDKMIALQEENNRIQGQMLRKFEQTGSFGGSGDRVAAEIMDLYAERRAGALRSI